MPYSKALHALTEAPSHVQRIETRPCRLGTRPAAVCPARLLPAALGGPEAGQPDAGRVRHAAGQPRAHRVQSLQPRTDPAPAAPRCTRCRATGLQPPVRQPAGRQPVAGRAAPAGAAAGAAACRAAVRRGPAVQPAAAVQAAAGSERSRSAARRRAVSSACRPPAAERRQPAPQ
ncbi:hypothetical protein D3C81_1711080 [compost metagenome]